MNIAKGSTQTVAFLLVDKNDFDQPVLSEDVSVRIAKNGKAFEDISGNVAAVGAGWYRVGLGATHTDTTGPLIFVASAPGSVEWRDIHYVVEPSADNGSGGEETKQPEEPETPVEGGGSSKDIGPNLVRDGSFTGSGGGWIFYTNGRGSYNVSNNTARVTISQLGNNMQLYQSQIVIRQAKHRLSFEAKCSNPRQMQVILHQHELPRRNLGVLQTVQLTNQFQRVEVVFDSPIAESNARLRFWFVTNSQPGDVFEIRDVQLYEQSA